MSPFKYVLMESRLKTYKIKTTILVISSRQQLGLPCCFPYLMPPLWLGDYNEGPTKMEGTKTKRGILQKTSNKELYKTTYYPKSS